MKWRVSDTILVAVALCAMAELSHAAPESSHLARRIFEWRKELIVHGYADMRGLDLLRRIDRAETHLRHRLMRRVVARKLRKLLLPAPYVRARDVRILEHQSSVGRSHAPFDVGYVVRFTVGAYDAQGEPFQVTGTADIMWNVARLKTRLEYIDLEPSSLQLVFR